MGSFLFIFMKKVSTIDKVERAHSHSRRTKLEKNCLCGCFYCLKIFRSVAIVEWTDNDETALCPYCGIDSVIGESPEYELTVTFLKQMHERWFN